MIDPVDEQVENTPEASAELPPRSDKQKRQRTQRVLSPTVQQLKLKSSQKVAKPLQLTIQKADSTSKQREIVNTPKPIHGFDIHSTILEENETTKVHPDHTAPVRKKRTNHFDDVPNSA
jgi:hypothetical protein